MHESDDASVDANSDPEGGGAFHLSPGAQASAAQLAAEGPTMAAVLAAGLRGLLAFALAADPSAEPPDGTLAVSIAGRARSPAALFAALADDVLAQLDLHGTGMRHVRLDGLLRTDDGGWSAWGYLIGDEGPLPDVVSLVGPLEWIAGPDRVTLRCELRRA
ncbi:MAG: hypothetical protein IT337_12845 [Thermomicrobiales bacterium]|nr:hypothetical protein [Thermomicrobiales bacterium]